MPLLYITVLLSNAVKSELAKAALFPRGALTPLSHLYMNRVFIPFFSSPTCAERSSCNEMIDSVKSLQLETDYFKSERWCLMALCGTEGHRQCHCALYSSRRVINEGPESPGLNLLSETSLWPEHRYSALISAATGSWSLIRCSRSDTGLSICTPSQPPVTNEHAHASFCIIVCTCLCLCDITTLQHIWEPLLGLVRTNVLYVWLHWLNI